MGGKSYYCDYCFCFLKNDINVRKTHNSGLTHKMAKMRYMRRFEDPRKILEEESKKAPCTRFLNGKYCKFDLTCNSTHFNQNQLERLQKLGETWERAQKRKATKKNRTNSNYTDTLRLPWQTNSGVAAASGKRNRHKKNKRLPQSLKPINLNRMSNDLMTIEWG